MSEQTHDALVENQFGPRAAQYLDSAVHAAGEDLVMLRELVAARPVTAALDLGTGAGHVAFLVAAHAQRVVAYDLSAAMVRNVRDEAARRGHGNIEALQGAVESLPFADGSFDLVVSRYTTHHWRDAGAGLREARRVLKPGGRAIFMDVFAPGAALLDTWLQALELLRDPSHVRNYSLAEWHALIAQAGFQPRRASCFRVRMDFAAWVARMNTPQAHVLALRSLQNGAPQEVSRYFELRDDGTFTIDSMLIDAAG